MTHLKKALGLYSATALVIGSVIGSGIFVSSAGMAKGLPNGWTLMGVWFFAGVMTILGALTQAELCSRMPVTGGLYVYFREVFGESLAYFYGWANFMIAGSGAIAAIAFIFASYLGEFLPLWHAPEALQKWELIIPYVGSLFPGRDLGEKLIGSVLILLLTALNAGGVKLGARVQSISASAKILAIAVLILAAFLAHGSWGHLNSVGGVTNLSAPWLTLCLAAMGGAFWSYDGWGNVAYIGGELKEPARILPRSILLGIGIVVVTYLLVNLAYIYILGMSGIALAPGERVASALMNAVAGPTGVAIVGGLILLSTFDTVNSGILTNSRVYYAMACEGWFWKPAARVSPHTQAPVVALWMQGIWSVVLLVSGSFDLVTSMYVFVNWLFYFLIPVALFVMRRRHKKQRPVFTVPAYPWLPLAFALFVVVFVLYTLFDDLAAYHYGLQPNVKSLLGLLLVFAGTPFYLILKVRRSRRHRAN